jgi:hypothetical protein
MWRSLYKYFTIMITVNKVIKINGTSANAPYTYTWNITEAAPGCVSVDVVSGVIHNPTAQFINAEFTFVNSTCLTDSTVTLTITYVDKETGLGCSQTYPIEFEDPCDTFDVSSISYSAPGTFSVTVTGGTPGYNYVWVYDEDLFRTRGNTNKNTIELNYIGEGTPPEQTNIQVTVTDQNGCQQTVSRNVVLCHPTLPNTTIFLGCNPDGSGNSINTSVCITPTLCPNTSIDWTTFTTISSNPNLKVQQLGPLFNTCGQGSKRLKVYTSSPLPEGIYTVGMHVTDTNGFQSNIGSLLVSIPACGPEYQPITTMEAPTFTIGCDLEIGDIFYIDLEAYVESVNEIDWSSFLFIDGGSPTAGPITTAGGATVTWNESTRQIEYEVAALTGTDSFIWTICDIEGNCAKSSTYAIYLECATAPVASDDTECGACNAEVEHDIIANDTVNGQLVNVEITSAPTNGIAVFNHDYASPRILYTGNQYFTGADSYTYQITNSFGLTDTATVTVNVICAGEDVQIAVCE